MDCSRSIIFSSNVDISPTLPYFTTVYNQKPYYNTSEVLQKIIACLSYNHHLNKVKCNKLSEVLPKLNLPFNSEKNLKLNDEVTKFGFSLPNDNKTTLHKNRRIRIKL